MRAVPHDGSIAPEDYVEVLDYEKAAAIVDRADRFAIGICSCRHEHEHAGGRTCKAPLDTCSTFGDASVGFMVRNGLAREVSKAEMLDNIARSRDLGLVLNADNVQRNVTFMCHCCGCCCNVLRGISRPRLSQCRGDLELHRRARPRALQRLRHLQPGVPDPGDQSRAGPRAALPQVRPARWWTRSSASAAACARSGASRAR